MAFCLLLLSVLLGLVYKINASSVLLRIRLNFKFTNRSPSPLYQNQNKLFFGPHQFLPIFNRSSHFYSHKVLPSNTLSWTKVPCRDFCSLVSMTFFEHDAHPIFRFENLLHISELMNQVWIIIHPIIVQQTFNNVTMNLSQTQFWLFKILLNNLL